MISGKFLANESIDLNKLSHGQLIQLINDEILTELESFSSVLDLSKNTTIRHTVAAPIEFTLGTDPAPRLTKKAIFYLVADGINIPTFGEGFSEKFNDYLNVANAVNRVYMEYAGDGTVVYEVHYLS